MPVGSVIVVIGDGEAAPAPVAAPTAEPDLSRSQRQGHGGTGQVRATPLVRRVAQELGVDLTEISGTGPQGRITEGDVRAAADGDHVAQSQKGDERREKVRGIRRRIVEHLTVSHREIPAVTFIEECDFTDADLARLVPLTLKAAAQALQEFPELNARLEGGEIVYLGRYDLGVAVQTDEGLVVTVVRSCESRGLDELDADVRRLADAARAGTLAPEDLRGSTFTITSAGKLGGLFVTPLVNHPEVGILGVHRIEERPVVRDGEIVVRRIGNVSVTFDHRVVDGARAAAFTLRVIELLQS